MKSILNQYDEEFINNIQQILNNSQVSIIEYDNQYYISDVSLESEGFDTWQEMTFHFIHELQTQETKKYVYNPLQENKIYRAIMNLYHPQISDWMILRLNELFCEDHHFQTYAIKTLIQFNQFDLSLELIKKGCNYFKKVDAKIDLDNPIIDKIFSIKNLLKQYPQRKSDLIEAFSEHIKNSTIDITQVGLILVYSTLFGHDNIDEFLAKHNQPKLSPLCINENRVQLVSFQVNLMTLLSNACQIDMLELIARKMTEKKLNFPSFYILKTQDYLSTICVEEQNMGDSLKVQTLFNELVSMRYSLKTDDNDLILESIVEKINLNYSINDQKITHKKAKI
jgi:hypothetical protein